MATLITAAQFAENPDARTYIMAGMVASAVNVMAEAGTTTYHDQRVALATQAIRTPQAVVDAFCWAVSTNATVVDEWTADNRSGAVNDMPFAIDSVWNAVAGAAAPTTTA